MRDPELADFLAPALDGDTLGQMGPYRVLKVLGAGGMGVVFLAEDPELKRKVVLKVMRPALAASATARQRFQREAQAMASVLHDHIAHINQVGQERGLPFPAMPYLDGETLEDRLRREKQLPAAEVVRIGREIAEGLAAAHAHGLIHRDIKPANIWLEGEAGPAATGGRVKLLDFGLARGTTDDAHLTQSGAIAGTPAYMSPEQAQSEPIDARSDLFSLGCVLYRMCTGQLPFQGPSTLAVLRAVTDQQPPPPPRINPEVPLALSDLILRLLAKDRTQRPESAAVVAAALAELVRPAPATADRPVRRRWLPRVAAAVAAVFAAVALAGAICYWQTDNGVVRIEINDPDVQVAFDRNGPTFKGVENQEIKVRAGKVGLHVQRGGMEFDTEKLVLKRGDKITLKVEWFKEGKLQVVQGERVIGEKAAPPVAAAKNAADDEWIKEVTAMPPAKQVEAVTAKLKERNPDWKGQVTWESGTRGITIARTDGNTPDPTFTDLSPVRALTGLQRLSVRFTGVTDLSPLKGMPLTALDISTTKVTDLSPLRGMPLTHLDCGGLPVTDLSVLKDLPLTDLSIYGDWVYDLSPLKGMPLTSLSCGRTLVTDLSPLKGMPLKKLDCRYTKVVDLSPLKEMPLNELVCDEEAERDIGVMLSLKSLQLINETPVTRSGKKWSWRVHSRSGSRRSPRCHLRSKCARWPAGCGWTIPPAWSCKRSKAAR